MSRGWAHTVQWLLYTQLRYNIKDKDDAYSVRSAKVKPDRVGWKSTHLLLVGSPIQVDRNRNEETCLQRKKREAHTRAEGVGREDCKISTWKSSGKKAPLIAEGWEYREWLWM